MVNVIPLDHVDDVPVVMPDQHDDVPVVPEPVLVNEDEDSEDDAMEEEEDPQEEEDDMEVDIEKDENELELTYPYEEIDPLNPSLPTFESESKDAIKVENPIEHEDETILASVHEVGESSTAPFLREDSNALLPGLMRRDINSLFGRMASLSRRLCGREMALALVEKKGKAKDEFYGKLILDLGNKVRSSVEIMPPKSAPLTQAAIRQMIKDNVDVTIAAERARQENVRNKASGSRLARDQDAAPAARECTFAGFMKCNPTAFRGTERAVELMRWFEKTESVFGISECVEGKKEIQRMEHELWNLKVKEYNIVPYTQRFIELGLMCTRMVKSERVKVDAYIQGLIDNIKGEVTSSKPANLNEDNKQRQGNARAMVTAHIDGKLPLCKRCLTHHVGKCTIKCHKCGKIRHKSRYGKEKNVATGANALPIPTCYDCGEQGHTRNRCLKKVKQEEVREVRGQAYAIKDAEPKGPNVVTGASYEVELAEGRVVSTKTILKGCTLNLVN
uniref:CCHC-type domain-containing protein n=1 Tax=Tanacetum cinerariifolium TaxID=118510 RepID=A0A6L2MCK1_TANCI|nr:hypothetical protein [Tanacetum cinerariifolium]